MKALFQTMVIVAVFACSSAYAGVLVTPGFAIVIAEQCQEGNVACAQVVYTGVNRKTGAALTLRGKALTAMCADGVTPCHHLGWVFENGAVTYTVTDAGELTVTESGRTLTRQAGKWVR